MSKGSGRRPALQAAGNTCERHCTQHSCRLRAPLFPRRAPPNRHATQHGAVHIPRAVVPRLLNLQERNQRDWQYHLESLHKGTLNPDIEYTIAEVVGNTPVSIEDLQYACAIVSRGMGIAMGMGSRCVVLQQRQQDRETWQIMAVYSGHVRSIERGPGRERLPRP